MKGVIFHNLVAVIFDGIQRSERVEMKHLKCVGCVSSNDSLLSVDCEGWGETCLVGTRISDVLFAIISIFLNYPQSFHTKVGIIPWNEPRALLYRFSPIDHSRLSFLPVESCVNLFSNNSAFDFRNNGVFISERIIFWQHSNRIPFVSHTYTTGGGKEG